MLVVTNSQVSENIGEATTAAIVKHPAVDLFRQQVFDHLEDLRERDVLTRQQDAEDGRRVVWCDTESHRLGEHGDTELEDIALEDLDDAEVRQLARSSIYTWKFTNLTSIFASPTGDSPAKVSALTQAAVNGGDRPPADAD